jgi:hypothetical protein
MAVSRVVSTAPDATPWRSGALALRLTLAEFAAVANAIPGLVLPEGFRPSQEAQPISAPEIAESLTEAALLLRDGDEVVLCPQLTGLLRLFERAAVTLRLRARLREPDDDTHVRWLTDVALAEGRGARLTRAAVLDGADVRSAGVMDGDSVAVGGFSLAQTVPQLLGCFPALDAEPLTGPQREVVDVLDLAARSRDAEHGALTLDIHSPAARFMDVWLHDRQQWRRVVPDGEGRLALIAVGRDALAAQLTDVLSESVLAVGAANEARPVAGGRDGS